jgi:hypothetical protein
MKNIRYIIFIVLAAFIVSSCQEWIDFKDPVIEHSSAWPLTGEWYVIEYYEGDAGLEAAYGPYSINVYNSSFSEDSIWVENIYDSGFKVKARKTGTNTFAVEGAEDINGVAPGFTFDISEAQVINTDSIAFRVIIYDPDGVVYDDYWEAGYRKTGFEGILD